MGRRKNCIKNRLRNLHKNTPKAKSQAPEASVEPSTPELGIDSDSEEYTSDLELEDNEIQEIQTDSDLLAFTAKLQAAHDSMVRKEREKRAATKRKLVYTGNSDRTKRRQRLEGKKMEAAGFPSIMSFFHKNTEPESGEREEVRNNGCEMGT